MIVYFINEGYVECQNLIYLGFLDDVYNNSHILF